MIGRRSILKMIGAAPVAAAAGSASPAQGAFRSSLPDAAPTSRAPFPSTSYGTFGAKRLAFLRRLAGDPDLEHQLYMEARAALHCGGFHVLPADLASKRSWSPAFKQLEMEKRIIARELDRDLHGNRVRDRIGTFIARVMDGPS